MNLLDGPGTPTDDLSAEPQRTDHEPTQVAAPDPLATRLDQIDQALQSVRAELAAARETAAARERTIDRLHEENQRLRAGERQLVLRPLLVDLQRLHADLIRQAAGLPADLSAAQAAELLGSFAQSVELALERGGVRVFRPDVGEPFDSARQRAVGVLPAPSPGADGRIVEVLGSGYLDTATDRALAPAVVRVHRWTEPDAPATVPSANPAPVPRPAPPSA